jgi:hypothetical protein
MPAFKPDIEILKPKRPDKTEGASALTKSDWMRLIIESVHENIPTASSDQAQATAEAIVKKAEEEKAAKLR